MVRVDGGRQRIQTLLLMRENMKMIRRTVTVFISGRVAMSIKAIIRMIRDMAMET
jgi:hypothetical protein